MSITRRSFIGTAGIAAAAATSSVALADETSPSGIASVLQSRTTLHAGYDPDTPVSDEDLQLLLEAAFSAPTGGNQRAIEFFPVNDPDVLAALRNAHANFGALESAPLAIVITTNHDLEKFPELLEFDAGIAAMAICAQAAELGLSTCCMSIAPQYDRMSGVGAALNLPTDTNAPVYDPLIMVAIGYPAADTVTSASVNNYTDDQVHLNGFKA